MAKNGLAGLYKGIAIYLALCANPALQFGLFERAKSARLRGGKKALGALEAFVLGALAKIIAVSVVYPAIRCKVLVQSRADR